MKSLTVKAIGMGNIYISLWLGKYSLYDAAEVFHLMASQDIKYIYIILPCLEAVMGI